MGRGAFAKEPRAVVKVTTQGDRPWKKKWNHPLRVTGRAAGGKGHRDAEAWRRGGAAASHCW